MVAFSVERRRGRSTPLREDQVDLDVTELPSLDFGIGIAVSDDHDCRLAIHYPWVEQSHAPFRDELTGLARGEVDVAWVGPVAAYRTLPTWTRTRNRPLTIGSSVAHYQGTAGTLTGFVQTATGVPHLLGCNHVLALCNRGARKDPILQPSPRDGGGSTDAVGSLARTIPLDRRRANAVDCAMAAIEEGIEFDPTTLEGFGQLKGMADSSWFGPQSGKPAVAKLGRTTGATRGRRTVIAMSQRLIYDGFGTCTVDDLMAIEPAKGFARFSDGGDSGGLVFVPTTLEAVGMVIGGSATVSYASRLDKVLSRLSARLMV